MSLDVTLSEMRMSEVFSDNITHNLNTMAEAAGLYEVLWRPEDLQIRYAHELVGPLRNGLAKLTADPEKFRALNPKNGWGAYEDLVQFVEAYLEACIGNPLAEVSVSR